MVVKETALSILQSLLCTIIIKSELQSVQFQMWLNVAFLPVSAVCTLAESPLSASSSSMSRLSSPSVRVTEYSDRTNPHPVAHGNHADEEELDVDERESVISPSKLVRNCYWCGTDWVFIAVVLVPSTDLFIPR